MHETPLAVLNQGQADAFERAAAVARAELHPEAETNLLMVQQTDVLIGKAARSALELRETWEAAWSELEARMPDEIEIQGMGEHLRVLFARWQTLLSALRQDAMQLAAEGLALPSLPLLEQALEATRRLQDALEKNWPWADRPWLRIDPKMIEESRAAIARGEGKEIGELIRELQGRVRPGSQPANG
jgi:hypothetical protein